MIHNGTAQSGIEGIRLAIGRAGFTAIIVGLMLGVSLFLIGQAQSSKTVLALIIGLMLVLPLVNVAAVLAEEVRRRDWAFVAVAGTVLGQLAFNIARRLLS